MHREFHNNILIVLLRCSPCYYVLCSVFLLLFPLGTAALLHSKLALTGTSHDSRCVQGSNKGTLKILTTFYVLWCAYRRGAQIFQQYRSHPKILGAIKKVPYWAPTNIGCHGTKFRHHGNLVPRICASLICSVFLHRECKCSCLQGCAYV
jgi:hypothetical protein